MLVALGFGCSSHSFLLVTFLLVTAALTVFSVFFSFSLAAFRQFCPLIQIVFSNAVRLFFDFASCTFACFLLTVASRFQFRPQWHTALSILFWDCRFNGHFWSMLVANFSEPWRFSLQTANTVCSDSQSWPRTLSVGYGWHCASALKIFHLLVLILIIVLLFTFYMTISGIVAFASFQTIPLLVKTCHFLSCLRVSVRWATCSEFCIDVSHRLEFIFFRTEISHY